MDIRDNVGYLIHHIAFVLGRQSDQVLQDQLGLGFSQFKILLILQNGTGIQQKQIAKKLGQTEASISRQIKLLADQGLITSQASPTNRRERITKLTGKGMQVSDKAMEILNSHHAPIFSRLSERQQQDLKELLSVMHDAACSGNLYHNT